MRNRLYIIGGILVVAGLVVFWLALLNTRTLTPKVPIQSKQVQSTAAALPSSSVFTAQPPPPSTLTLATPTMDPKTTAIMAIWGEQNAQPQDFYGKVVDQYGLPIEGVTAIGTLMWIQGVDVPEKRETHTTQSDKSGEFQFTALRGWQVGVVVRKNGYQMGQGSGFYQAPNKQNKATPNERAVFTMWKLKGAEPMVHKEIDAGLSCDGSPMTLDLLTGHRVASGGDLTLSLIRNPLNIDRAKPFDWSVTLTINGGGLVEIMDLYPNEAPVEGYVPSVTMNMHAGPPYFTGNKVEKSYYYKSRDGKVYGRMKIQIAGDSQPPPTAFEIEVFSNPAGSRNLEYDRYRPGTIWK